MKDPDAAAAPPTDDSRKRKARTLKKRKSPDDDSTGSLDKKPKLDEELPHFDLPIAPKVRRVPKPPVAAKSNEMEFGLHVGNLCSPLMTFESTVRALLKTLNHGADIQLAEQNVSSCAECRGGGDLLCCDCCQFAFHVDCLQPLERGSYLHVPFEKYGMRRRPDDASRDEFTLMLEEHEWFCPYCLSLPIQRHWKRGVPQFLRTFEGFDSSVVASDDFDRTEGQLTTWCNEVDEFINDEQRLAEQESFPPSILLALTGIRRAVQRLGPAFQIETRAEVERLEQDHVSEVTSPVIVDPDVAEPVDVKDEAARPKTNIMKSGSKKSVEEQANNIPPSDEAMSESDATKPNPVRSRSRRTRSKPIVPTENYNAADNGEAARMNVGGSFQVPSVHKYYTEALSMGCDYSIIDHYSVFARLPADARSFIPPECIPAKNTCRLMYSVSQWAQRKRPLLMLDEDDVRRCESTVPLTTEELAIYIRQVLHLWPAWIQWPASQEYALKILHHCQYDAKAALKLLCTNGMQFRPICDPPVKPYMNKWRPRDKRGLISTIPFPPPSLALIFAGVGESTPTAP